MKRTMKDSLSELPSNYASQQTLLKMLVVGLAFSGSLAQAATTYTMKDIGLTNPTAINSAGQVLGNNVLVYDNGLLTNIQTMANAGVLYQGYDMNALGQVVGFGANYGPSAFIRNSDGTVSNVGTLAGYTAGIGYAINDLGQVVGMLTPSSATPGCVVHAYLGSADISTVEDLGTLGGNRTYANDINAKGQVVGMSSVNPATDCTVTTFYHAYTSTAGGLKDLHDPTWAGNYSSAFKVNNNGLVAGQFTNGLVTVGISSYYPTGYPIRHAIIWDTVNGTYKDLGNGARDSSFRAINASGVAVGYERTFSTANFASTSPSVVAQNAVLADPSSTSVIDLTSLVTGLPAGWYLYNAVDINDVGQIAAVARDASGLMHGVLLTPASTTATVLLPTAPSGLTATPVSSNQMDLKWLDNANNETDQYLERCEGVNCTTFVRVAVLVAGVTSYSDIDVLPATSYSYRIMAHNLAGNSNYSNTVSATTKPLVGTAAPIAPSNLSGGATSRSRIVLAWTDNSDNEESFIIERCAGQNCTNFVVVATVAANITNYTNGGLSRNTYYSYRVQAANATGKSTYSNTLTSKTFF